MHPENPDIIATGGVDETVRIFDNDAKIMLSKVSLGGVVGALAWSPDGFLLAVGFGHAATAKAGSSDKATEGSFKVLNSKTLEVMYAGRDSKQGIACMSFSPDGTKLALGSNDTNVYVYNAHKGFSFLFACDAFTSRVGHLQFSDNSLFLLGCSGTHELHYFNMANGEVLEHWEDLKVLSFDDYALPVGWAVQGLWKLFERSIRVHAVSRARSERFFAAFDDRGSITLVGNPCLKFSEKRLRSAQDISTAKVSSSLRGKATIRELVLLALGHAMHA